MSAYLAKDGFTGAADIFTGPQGMAAGMSSDANPARLNDRLGSRWATAETSFKYHASCRHTHPAADALLQVMQANGLKADDLARVTTHVRHAHAGRRAGEGGAEGLAGPHGAHPSRPPLTANP